MTEVFTGLAEAVTTGLRMPQLERVALPHPLNDQPEGYIRKAVNDRMDVLVAALTLVRP